jgi:hypothetical protein
VDDAFEKQDWKSPIAISVAISFEPYKKRASSRKYRSRIVLLWMARRDGRRKRLRDRIFKWIIARVGSYDEPGRTISLAGCRGPLRILRRGNTLRECGC